MHCTLDRFNDERKCTFAYEFSFSQENSYGLRPALLLNPREHVATFLWPWLLPSAELVQVKAGTKVFKSENCVERPDIKSATCPFDSASAESILNTLTSGGEAAIKLVTNKELYDESLSPLGYGSALAAMDEGLGAAAR